MRAFLLAAGLGTRLRPLTDTMPKCLVPIHGEPLLGIWLRRLTAAGIGPFLINTHYLSEQVEAFIASSPYRDKVTLIHEPELLGTAGSLMANLDFFEGEDGLLIHADNYCLADFREFIAAHRQRPDGCLITLMAFRSPTPETCGILKLDERGIVSEFHEKVLNPPGNLANGAVYLLSSDFIRLSKTEFSNLKDFSIEIIPKITKKIFSHETKSTFIDIGTIESYGIANRKINSPSLN